MAPSAVRSEDVLGQKWDRCLSDSLIKLGTGLGLGLVFSIVIFKRKKWPVIIGSGIGLGVGLANCQHSLNQTFKWKSVHSPPDSKH